MRVFNDPVADSTLIASKGVTHHGKVATRTCVRCGRLTLHRQDAFSASSWKTLAWCVAPLLWTWQVFGCNWQCQDCGAGKPTFDFGRPDSEDQP